MEVETILKNARVASNGRRILPAASKRVIVEAWEREGLSGPEFCRRHGLIASMLYRWRKDAIRGANMGIKEEGHVFSKAERDALQRENEELKKALGEMTLDNKILKKKLALDAQKQALRRLK